MTALTVMAMHVQEQSRKFVKPSTPTPTSLRRLKIGFIDEFAPIMNVNVVLFFSVSNDNMPYFVSQLETSLQKALTRFNPLAGRYNKETHIVECNDQGAEFIRAKASIKLQDLLDKNNNVKLVDELIRSRSGATDLVTDPILSIQVTAFVCGGVALGISISHRIADASTLSTFLIEWAGISREENEVEFHNGPGFISSSLFPALGIAPLELGIPTTIYDDGMSPNVTLKLSFNNRVISRLKENAILNGGIGSPKWSKVQLVTSVILKGLIGVDREIYGYPRDCTLLQPINLRGKTASVIPKDSCGNIWGILPTNFKTADTIQELAEVLRDSIKNEVKNYSKVHHDTEEGETMVLNSFAQMADIPPKTNLIWITSWCHFPFYEADFGFGKPVWANGGSIGVRNLAYLMDDVEGNGVEAYVGLESKDIPYFEKALDIKAFLT